MKWRLVFGDPGVHPHERNVLNSQKIEVAAGEGSALLGIGAAVAMAHSNRVLLYDDWTLVEASFVPDDDHVTDWMIPYPVARLGFNPRTVRDPALRRVWRDPLARTQCLAVRYRHLTDQDFHTECLEAARVIRRLQPRDAEGLERAMRIGMPGYAGGIAKPFYSQLLPYVLGEGQLGYVTVA